MAAQIGTPQQVVQLGHAIEPGMPRPPVHPPFLYGMSMMHRPGDAEEITGTADSFAMGTHVGTHVDSVFHIAVGGHLHGGVEVGTPAARQSAVDGIAVSARENFEPVVAPGVLLDFPRHLGVERVEDTLGIGPDLIRSCAAEMGVEIESGDAVLFRTGWDTLWPDAPAFLSQRLPGVNPEGARYLGELGVRLVGSDTAGFEQVPSAKHLEVHAELLVTRGIPIIENLNLVPLAATGVGRFLFVMAPLRLGGATGCPVNPLALLS